VALRVHCNRCGANDHETNQCPYHPFKRKEVHLLQEGCCSDSDSTFEFHYSSEEEILINQDCNCRNPNFFSCKSNTDSSDFESEPEIKRKLKACIFHNTGDQEAQMLAQIKALLEGEMKNSLLDTFVKTVKTDQRNKTVESSKREPLFIDAYYDRNTKTFIKFNREEKLQNTSVNDLAKEVLLLKKEVFELKGKIKRMEEEAEYSFKIDSWARQEIREIK